MRDGLCGKLGGLGFAVCVLRQIRRLLAFSFLLSLCITVEYLLIAIIENLESVPASSHVFYCVREGSVVA